MGVPNKLGRVFWVDMKYTSISTCKHTQFISGKKKKKKRGGGDSCTSASACVTELDYFQCLDKQVWEVPKSKNL